MKVFGTFLEGSGSSAFTFHFNFSPLNAPPPTTFFGSELRYVLCYNIHIYLYKYIYTCIYIYLVLLVSWEGVSLSV